MEITRYRIMRLDNSSIIEVDGIQQALSMSATILQDAPSELGSILTERIRGYARTYYAESSYWEGELSEHDLFLADVDTESKLTDSDCEHLFKNFYRDYPEAKDLLAVYSAEISTGIYEYERMFVTAATDTGE